MVGGLITGGVLAIGAVAGSCSPRPPGGDGDDREVALRLSLGDGQTTPVSVGWTLAF